MRYLVNITIDQRPTRTEWVSERIYQTFVRLGWTKDGRVVLIKSQ